MTIDGRKSMLNVLVDQAHVIRSRQAERNLAQVPDPYKVLVRPTIDFIGDTVAQASKRSRPFSDRAETAASGRSGSFVAVQSTKWNSAASRSAAVACSQVRRMGAKDIPALP